ncbi:MAG: hypothetical protein D6E12_01985 [Desulfovibrio sp.]|nr:MAG: hypothetical protein D6E12_01985 [Desulfovibrio sp.]
MRMFLWPITTLDYLFTQFMRLLNTRPGTAFWIVLSLGWFAAFLLGYGRNVLKWDEWVVFSDLLARLNAGDLQFSDFYAQYNEQRIFLGRLFGLFSIEFLHFNRWWEYGLNVCLILGHWLLAMAFFERDRRALSMDIRWPHICWAMVIWSTVQWESFLKGFNSTILLPPLTLALVAFLVHNQRLSPWRFALCTVLAFTASFSFANGLFLWACLLFPLATIRNSPGVKRTYLVLWCVLGVLAWLGYFADYSAPPHHPSLWGVFSAPLHALRYFVTYMGGCISSNVDISLVAIIYGTIGLLLAGEMLVHLVRSRVSLTRTAPWLAYMAFALLTGMSTTVGRSGFGIGQALESRYSTFSSCFWIGLIGLYAIRHGARGPGKKKPWPIVWQERFLLFFCMGWIIGSVIVTIILWNNRIEAQDKAIQEMYTLEHPERMSPLFPDTAYLQSLLPHFFERRLAMYCDVGRFEDYAIMSEATGRAGAVLTMDIRPGDDESWNGVLLTGWARDMDANEPAPLVAIVASGRILYVSDTGLDAPESAENAPEGSGWRLFLPAPFLPDGPATLTVYAIQRDGEHMARLASNSPLHVDLPPMEPPQFTYTRYFYNPNPLPSENDGGSGTQH